MTIGVQTTVCELDLEHVIIWINVLFQVLFGVVDLKIHPLALLCECFVDGADIVFDIWYFAGEHCIQLVHMAPIELHFIAPVTVLFKLSAVLDSRGWSSNDVL